MEPKRFQLDGPTLPELKARILAEHGADARIVSAERVTVGGIRGFFARRHYEVTVEVPERRRRAAHAQPVRMVPLERDDQGGGDGDGIGDAHPGRAARLGILALLEDADGADDAGTLARPRTSVQTPLLSTGSAGFAQLMDELTFTVAEPVPERVSGVLPLREPEPSGSVTGAVTGAGAPRDAGTRQRPATLSVLAGHPLPGRAGTAAVPRPFTHPGDLVVLVGAPAETLRVAGMMAAMDGAAEVLVAGSVVSEGARRVDDRRSALAARAGGVARGRTCFLAFGIGETPGDREYLGGDLLMVGADQTWVVVDAGRKPSDTAEWVGLVAAIIPIDAVAVVGSTTTSSPETVDDLGIPVGWVDGAPAASATLGPPAARLPDTPDARARLA
ncbi:MULTISPECIES: hypothetical protein [unclassified Cryobacterium]|uniref:hypothetical protein n=1 Tax=unclassified Cryobacterium TaxID=2649013 RepID=UPI0010696080|nr:MULTISPECIES: hypothetical protein [unclassified Cryobacterium]TFB95302.1 hypothetical protein E3O39_14115 [Cryobacterium sp. MDB2-A-1]TFC11337.1 hypothetical protein E3O35_11885 [Cryobacterium sp. MDB2-A-2]TFC11634.1 hypothetical protein E3O59_01415 [Cryobacterium sp. MDB2-33-2]TFC18885.1 hypothetical protein E3O51_07635 [Cryobacterium sp. MDB2-10]TFC25009.1 hypothetical protein E3O55_15255 [Cryobacterium sp. MDB1-18-2]